MNTWNTILNHKRLVNYYAKNNTASSRVYRFPACTESQSHGQTEVTEASEFTGDPDLLEYVNTKVIKSVFE